MDGWMDGWIDLSFHPILDVIASIIYGLFRDQAAIFFEHIAACLSAFLLLSIYITQQTKGFKNGLCLYVFLHVKYVGWRYVNVCCQRCFYIATNF